MNAESIFYDGDDSINLEIELTESGLSVIAENENGVQFGTVFNVEEIEGLLAKMKKITSKETS